jgi:YD repeat-containing protein
MREAASARKRHEQTCDGLRERVAWHWRERGKTLTAAPSIVT